jgi:hypothetical protein
LAAKERKEQKDESDLGTGFLIAKTSGAALNLQPSIRIFLRSAFFAFFRG